MGLGMTVPAPAHGPVHQGLDEPKLTRGCTDQRRDGDGAGRGRLHVILATGAELAAAAQAGARVDDHDGAARGPDRVATAPGAGVAGVGQVGGVDRDARALDAGLHGLAGSTGAVLFGSVDGRECAPT